MDSGLGPITLNDMEFLGQTFFWTWKSPLKHWA